VVSFILPKGLLEALLKELDIAAALFTIVHAETSRFGLQHQRFCLLFSQLSDLVIFCFELFFQFTFTLSEIGDKPVDALAAVVLTAPPTSIDRMRLHGRIATILAARRLKF